MSARKFVLKDILLIVIGLVPLVGAVSGAHYFMTRDQGLTVRGSFFAPEIVSSKEDLARGLSGRDSIDRGAVMVFDFGSSGQHCMWMKDMKFAIDMVWLDDTKKVTAIERNVTPSTYPQSFCHDGKTVAEFAAGTADRVPLYIGDSLSY